MPPRLFKIILLLAALLAFSLTGAGCLGDPPSDIKWATPSGESAGGPASNGDGIQETLDTYARALVDKDRERFASILDAESPAFAAAELQRFDRLADVPFEEYYIELASQNETAPGTVAAKVATGFTLRGSFPELPDLDRAAYFLVRREDGWKLSGDASEQALGKKRDATFEDFGKIEVLEGGRAIVLYHDGQRGAAEQALGMAESAMPRLEQVLPGTSLPKVPIYVYGSMGEIDQSYPGKWQEWTGGASRQLGENENQGGEIIIDSQAFSRTNDTDPGYNPKMIAHELTHIALFPQVGNRTPPFLVEGLADHVAGIEDYGLLREQLRNGQAVSPTLRDLYQPGGFTALLTTEAATLAYEEADTAVMLLEQKYGNEKVLALLREFRKRESAEQNQDILVDDVFRSILGTSWVDFENEWQRYVTGG